MVSKIPSTQHAAYSNFVNRRFHAALMLSLKQNQWVLNLIARKKTCFVMTVSAEACCWGIVWCFCLSTSEDCCTCTELEMFGFSFMILRNKNVLFACQLVWVPTHQKLLFAFAWTLLWIDNIEIVDFLVNGLLLQETAHYRHLVKAFTTELGI